jgi:hypothetical protein
VSWIKLLKNIEPPDPVEHYEARDLFSRIVIVLIALTTVAAGATGYFHSRDATETDRVGVRAQELGVEAAEARVLGQQAAQTEFEKFELAQEELTQRAASMQRERFEALNTRVGNTAVPDPEVQRWAQLAERTGAQTEISEAGRYGPARDPSFPDLYFTSKQRDYWRLWALQDGTNEEYAAWKRHEVSYTTALTLFAVALYLFGLSVALRLRVTLYLAGLATVLVATGAVLAERTAATPPAPTSEHAADAYADGMVAFDLAKDPAAYRQAWQFFDQAVKARPGFAQAYSDRGDAAFQAASPQVMGEPAITTPAAARAAADDHETAYTLGLRTAGLLWNLGYEKFHVALNAATYADAQRLLAESIRFTNEGIAADPSEPTLRFNLGVAEVAAGHPHEAGDAFRAGVAATLAWAGHNWRYTRSAQNEFVGGALTDLNRLLYARVLTSSPRAREMLALNVRESKEYIVGSVSGRSAWPAVPSDAGSGAPSVSTFVEPLPAGLRWYASLPDFHRGHDTLSVQWYYQDPNRLGWSVLTDVSQLNTRGLFRSARADRKGYLYSEVRYLGNTTPPRCVQAGEYWVELYVNGQLVNSGPPAPQKVDPLATQAAVWRDLNAAACIPQDWEPWPAETTRGLDVGYRSPEHDSGMVVARFHHPWAPDTDAATRRRVAAGYLNYTLRALNGGAAVRAWTPPPSSQEYLSLQSMDQSWSQAGGRRMVAQTGVAEDGAVLVCAVFGPPEFFQEVQAWAIFNSFTTFGRFGPDY